ncbi:MAG TPA: nuclear transport factor 2 family protein [Acidimicrobiia bacterium]|nr:nuclear transport factor 2 family protein [Acidimicrobiia bacterium]
MSRIRELVAALYPALRAGDRATIERLVAPGFTATITAGLPAGIGGFHPSRDDMVDRGWWEMGRLFKIEVEPEQWIDCPDGRLLVIGRYVGTGRRTGVPFDAAFVHLFSAAGGQLTGLWHLTDSAQFVAALPGAGR